MRFISVSDWKTEIKMGTYTTNYNLFMPSIGEQGWGELVNNNFSTIDTVMVGLNTRMGTAESNIISLTSRMGTAETTITSNTSRIGTLETEADAFDNRITTLEAGKFDTITVNKIEGLNLTTANGEIGAYNLGSTITLAQAHNSTQQTTYTYRENIFNNTVTIECSGYGWESTTARAYLQVNGTIVVDTGTLTNRRVTRTTIVTLNEGDSLYAYANSKVSNGEMTWVKLISTGYLCK